MNSRAFFYLIFALSGFSGLIYESIWSHYLKLFLGHAAYAQTLVLAIFMGGLAIGSWICSRYSGRWHNLLLGYAMAEGIVGLIALLFHPLFDGFMQYSFNTIMPAIGHSYAINLYKWSASALIILPQSILLGMTFPLMSAALIRRFPGQTGGTLAMLYFTNSMGAVFGVLVSGFILIAAVGLPGTMQTAGLINILLAITVAYLAKQYAEPAPAYADTEATATDKDNWFLFLLIVAAGTGMASFIYEIAWIRMLSLVLGSSTHSFELMLSAFILGLALGGLWIKRRIDKLENITLYLAKIQIVMGMLAIITLFMYDQSFQLMNWLMDTLQRNETGYLFFNITSHSIAMMIMVPTTFCAGMTLPLITFALIKKGHGERAIGLVYATNTAGAIIGIFFAIHLGLPLLGIKGLLGSGAIIDITLGLSIWWFYKLRQNQAVPVTQTAVTIIVAVLFFMLFDLNYFAMASGVYRQGVIMDENDITLLYNRDGKAATVALTKTPDDVVGIRTNGKVDASIYQGPEPITTGDEATMVLAAAAPLALHPQARSIANIGMGSGLTTHALLSSDTIETVDTIEIEQFMVEAAQIFRPRVELAYSDPRSHIYIDDAKTFFSSRQAKYDIIISEPSNPWVSGTSSLFTEEFYQLIVNHLATDGILVQWLQLYEINMELVASVMKALDPYFQDYIILAPNDTDILILARQDGLLPKPGDSIFKQANMRRELEKVHIYSLSDLQLRIIGNKRSLQPLFNSANSPANSDYRPFLDLNAVRTRFLNLNAKGLISLRQEIAPALSVLGDQQLSINRISSSVPYLSVSSRAYQAQLLREVLLRRPASQLNRQVQAYTQLALPLLHECGVPQAFSSWLDILFNTLAIPVLPFIEDVEIQDLLEDAWRRKCSEHSSLHKNWLALFWAVSRHDASTMAKTAQTLLADDEQYQAVQYRYLVVSALSGSLAGNDKTEIKQVWQKYGWPLLKKNPTDMLLRLLSAHVEGKLNS